MEEHSLYSKFDVAKHKEKFPFYTEVVVYPDGTIEYAIPSHQEKLIAICMEKLGCSREELLDKCPKEFYANFITWLINLCHCVSVWYEFKLAPSEGMTAGQVNALKTLKENGCFAGDL